MEVLAARADAWRACARAHGSSVVVASTRIQEGSVLHGGTRAQSLREQERGITTCPLSTFTCICFLEPSLYQHNPTPTFGVCIPSNLLRCLPLNVQGSKKNKNKKLQYQQNSLVFVNRILNEEAPVHGKTSPSVKVGVRETFFLSAYEAKLVLTDWPQNLQVARSCAGRRTYISQIRS